jgi:hypothetical protein
MATITSPEKIRGMQSAYQRAINGQAQANPSFSWLNVGSRWDVPQEAAFVGRHGRVCVWVMPEGIEGLSNLTLAIMDIATREDAAPVSHPTLGVLPEILTPPAVPRRNFQAPGSGPVFTPGVN